MTNLTLGSDDPTRAMTNRVAAVIAAWGAAVVAASASGLLGQLWMPLYAALVVAGIAAPSLWYFRSAAPRAWCDRIGLRAITAFHIWRIPAALVFFWYGVQGALPAAFWMLAGFGDLLAGLYAAYVVRKAAPSAAQFRAMHRFGFADFVTAVAAGLTFTLLLDPRMSLLATLPMALIPLFGVGISGATHLIAFDMLRRGAASNRLA